LKTKKEMVKTRRCKGESKSNGELKKMDNDSYSCK